MEKERRLCRRGTQRKNEIDWTQGLHRVTVFERNNHTCLLELVSRMKNESGVEDKPIQTPPVILRVQVLTWKMSVYVTDVSRDNRNVCPVNTVQLFLSSGTNIL